MSLTLIHQYYKKVEDLIRFSGRDNEAVISREFEWLINAYCEKRKLKLVPQFEFKGKLGNSIRPDGTIKNDLRLDYGYWESKAKVDLEKEIQAKFNAGYPKTNILFEDSKTAVLYQEGERVMTADMRDAQALDKILTAFTTYEHPEVKNFNKAVENFKNDIPKIVAALQEMIGRQERDNHRFKEKRGDFWELCKNSINPDISLPEINEMLIQHILTEEIFVSIFSDAQFHQENNIAKELYEVEKTFFTGNTKRELLNSLRNYYEMIKAHATGIVSHTEKQTFLKSIYENFYKAYNPKGADRLGIVYTPSEIVKFQIESTDYLLEKHFGKTLADKNVEILDPATGTGTYICDLLDYIPTQYLAYKYKHEIHANEVAILPYYIANLNIEYVFQQKMGYYEEFQNICFVDTLDNTGGLNYGGKQFDMFGFSAENAERIKRQNEKKISVIIGNPPYNARQDNFNNQNANRLYKEIDKRIKDTYIKEGTAQNQIVVYDMYTRFFRWAMDRLNENGIISFITNRSFIDSRAFDGFRKSIQNEFSICYIIDTKSDVRINPKIAGTTHNVFGIQTGVAIMFLVKNQEHIGKCRIEYISMEDEWRKEDKLQWLREHKLSKMNFEKITPDAKGNWINLSDNDFEQLLPLISKEVKTGKGGNAIFELFSLGVASHRDGWVYDFDKDNLQNKMTYFIDTYQNTLVNANYERRDTIAWDRELTSYMKRGINKRFEYDKIKEATFRPFAKKFHYFDKHFNGMLYKWAEIQNDLLENRVIGVSREGNSKPFHLLASQYIFDLHTTGDSQCLPLYRYDKDGNRQDNLTDWALEQFRRHYTPTASHAVVPLLEKEGLGEVTPPSPPGEDIPPPGDFTWQKIMNNPLYKEKRRALRQNSTPAEVRLWEQVRNRRLAGKKFKRQYGVDYFILDFYCPEHKLAVELDGAHHYTPEGLQYDEARTAHLGKYGIRVLRFENKRVMQDLEGVLAEIVAGFDAPGGDLDSPDGEGVLTSPYPSLERRGSFAEAKQDITKMDIFHYVYAVLHHPAYRQKYELNLKRDFPRIPFYADFHKWKDWGRQLMDLHIGYEAAAPFPLTRKEVQPKQAKKKAENLLSDLEPPKALFEEQGEYTFVPKTRLKADKEKGHIEIDDLTTLTGIPPQAWDYKLGNRSALEWILDQYKERKPSDPTIAEKFDTYRFADYKEEVIGLLMRVCTVSVETVRIVGEMGQG